MLTADQPEQVLISIAHELAHARLESVLGDEHLGDDGEATERLVENFGRDVYDLGLKAALRPFRRGERAMVRAMG